MEAGQQVLMHALGVAGGLRWPVSCQHGPATPDPPCAALPVQSDELAVPLLLDGHGDEIAEEGDAAAADDGASPHADLEQGLLGTSESDAGGSSKSEEEAVEAVRA